MRFLLATGVMVALLVGQHEAEAKKSPEKVFRGQILTSNTRFPTSAKSVSTYIKKLKKNKKTKFVEDKKTKSWKIYVAAFFKKPLNDLEITVKLYDVTTGRRHLVNSFEQYTEGRGQTSLISHIKLEREFFGVNKKIMITMESRKMVLAQGTFHILGEEEKLSGKVDFTED
ncbi:MAG: hypothetical protein GY811_05155 [Myxococcales bacterium]|nr:hypothetical protein [Myxococcales bacterium]